MPAIAVSRSPSSNLAIAIKTTAFVVVALGVVVLVGWAFNVTPFKSVLPGFVTMKANTAFALLLCGIALGLTQRKTAGSERISQLCAVVATAVGAITLIQNMAGWDFGIDQLVFKDNGDVPGASHPGRMAPNTALSFVFVGTAVAMLRVRRLQTTACALLIAAGSMAVTLRCERRGSAVSSGFTRRSCSRFDGCSARLLNNLLGGVRIDARPSELGRRAGMKASPVL